MAEQSFSVGEKLQAPVCSSNQLDMLSCRDGAMQHCQQAPVSNEFSTAVLYCSEGGKVIYSVLQSPQDLSWSLFATASSGQVDLSPSLTLLVLFITSLKSRVGFISANASCFRFSKC